MSGFRKNFPILESYPTPKIKGRGRGMGNGKNVILLKKMRPGNAIINVPRKKAMSFKDSAWRNGIKILIRQLPDSHLYLIKKV